MGTGWRRAFCTSARRDQPQQAGPLSAAVVAASGTEGDGPSAIATTVSVATGPSMASFSPRSCSRLAFFAAGGSSSLLKSGAGGSSSGSSMVSGLLPPATASEPASPVLRCRTGNPKPASLDAATASQVNQPTATASAPCSPRPLSPFAALRSTLRLSRRSCGVCLQSVKAVRGTAVFIAECSHAFHFPCISTHVRKQRQGGQLVCPVCAVAWCQAPLLSLQPRNLDDDEAAIPDAPVMEPLIPAAPEAAAAAAPTPAAAAPADASYTGPWSEAIKQCAIGVSKQPPVPAMEQEITSKLTVKTTVAKKGGKQGDRSSVSKPGAGGHGGLAAIKSYNDDEPLLSPGGSRFNPIPEAAEEYEGVDDTNASSYYGKLQARPKPQLVRTEDDSSSTLSGVVHLQVTLGADIAFLSNNRGASSQGTTSCYVAALKVKTQLLLPLDSPSQRAPVDLVAVLDVGDGMVQPKFQAQKRALRLLISYLGPTDRLSVIAYASAAKRLLPLRRMNTHGNRSVRHVLDRLVVGQGAGASGEALRKAAKVLADRRERNPVGSVLLLSDGQRQQQQQQLMQQKGAPQASHHTSSLACMFSSNTAASGTRFAHLEIPVHGDQRSGPLSPPPQDSPEAAFARCISGLFSVVAQDARMELAFAAGVVAGVYSSRGQPAAALQGGGGEGDVFRLGDLYSEEERELFVELRVPAALARGQSPENNTLSRLTARCSYLVPATRELVPSGGEQCFTVTLPAITETLPQQPHQHRWSLIPRSPRSQRSSTAAAAGGPAAERLKNQFLTARAISESRRLSEAGEDSAAAQILTSTRSAFLHRHQGSGSAEEGARALEAELAELQKRRQQQKAMRRRRRNGGGEREEAAAATVSYSEEAVEESGGPGEALTPTSAWRAAERLAKVAMMRKSLNRRVSDLHGFEDARF